MSTIILAVFALLCVYVNADIPEVIISARYSESCKGLSALGKLIVFDSLYREQKPEDLVVELTVPDTQEKFKTFSPFDKGVLFDGSYFAFRVHRKDGAPFVPFGFKILKSDSGCHAQELNFSAGVYYNHVSNPTWARGQDISEFYKFTEVKPRCQGNTLVEITSTGERCYGMESGLLKLYDLSNKTIDVSKVRAAYFGYLDPLFHEYDILNTGFLVHKSQTVTYELSGPDALFAKYFQFQSPNYYPGCDPTHVRWQVDCLGWLDYLKTHPFPRGGYGQVNDYPFI